MDDLRDRFAMHVMTGFLAHGSQTHAIQETQVTLGADADPRAIEDAAMGQLADAAFRIADAMMHAR